MAGFLAGFIVAPVNARRLRRFVVLYATLAMVAISVAVAAIAIVPLAARLKADVRSGFEHEMTLKVMAGAEALGRARNLAEQVTSRTVIREKLEQYNRGAIALADLTEFTRDKLADALTLSPELVGISRFAANGEPVVSIGAFSEEGPMPSLPEGAGGTILGLHRQGGRPFLVAAAPIRKLGGPVAGIDVVVVDAAGLQAIVDDAGAAERTGWAALVDASGESPRVLMAARDDLMLRDGAAILAGKAVASGAAVSDQVAGQLLVAAPLPQTGWALVSAMPSQRASHDVDMLLAWVLLGAAAAIALGMGGLVLVLRPLTGALIVSSTEMERQMTELGHLKVDLAARTHALSLSRADLQEFTYAASHDLQEPVRTVVGFSQLLQRRFGGQMGTEADEFIGFIVQGAERMQRQINDLLSYTCLDHGEAKNEDVPMDGVLDDALAGLAEVIRESGADITRRPLPVVHGQRDALVRLLQSLISNGLKFTAKGEAPRLAIAGHVVDGWAEITVRDHGIGIDPEYHERVFRMFERLEPNQYTGTGIGLAICRKVAEMHGGRIWVDSSRGVGATFHIRLPAA